MDAGHVRANNRHESLPIGRTARIAYELDAMRAACSRVAQNLTSKKDYEEDELEECARLDEALYAAQRLLKSTVRNVMLSRLSRRSGAR